MVFLGKIFYAEPSVLFAADMDRTAIAEKLIGFIEKNFRYGVAIVADHELDFMEDLHEYVWVDHEFGDFSFIPTIGWENLDDATRRRLQLPSDFAKYMKDRQ